MNNEVERYVGELRELREKVKYLEAELAKQIANRNPLHFSGG